MGKKLVSMLLVLAIGLALLPGMAVSTHAAETTVPEGATKMSAWIPTDNVYPELPIKHLYIEDADDFKAFQSAMCTYGETFDGYTVYLMTDLAFNTGWSSPVHLDWGWSYLTDGYGTLSDDSVDHIVSAKKPSTTAEDYYALPAIDTTNNQNSDKKEFNGTFEGMGHSISGLYISGNYGTCVALFGQVTETATVNDLTVLNSYYDNPHSTTASSAVKPIGGLFSIVNSGATAVISNCYVDVDLYDGKVPSSTATDGQVGGLVGYCKGTLEITDCVYAGSASYNYISGASVGKRNIGGAVGLADGATITMTNFTFAGAIYNKWQRVSGGIGRVQGVSTVTMNRCLNIGRIYAGNGDAAGVIGSVLTDKDTTITLNDCYTLTNDKGYLMIGASGTTYSENFKAEIYTNGTLKETVSDSTVIDKTTTNTVTVGSCKAYLNKTKRTYSFVESQTTALSETPYGGVAEGETQKYLSDVFTIVGGVIAPKSLYENVLSNHIPTQLTNEGYSLSLEGKIWINKYASFKDADKDLSGFNLNANAGLLIWNSKPTDPTCGTETDKITGLIWAPGEGAYGQSTEGIAAAEYGETLYMREYVQVGDGYIYGELKNYSVKGYCESVLAGENYSDALKELSMAVLDYGAAAQKYFVKDVADEDLVNAGLSEKYPDYAVEYENGMIDSLVALGEVDNENNVPYTNITETATIVDKNTSGQSLSLDEGIRINYYYYLNETGNPDNIAKAELLTWSGVDGELTYDNATVTELTWLDGKEAYAASGALIAAPEWGNTIYACARFTDADSNPTYTAVTPYSAHRYAELVISNSAAYREELVEVCKALVVYSEYALAYKNS